MTDLEMLFAAAADPATPGSATLSRSRLVLIHVPGRVDARLAALDAGRLDVATAPLISAWGRRPETDR